MKTVFFTIISDSHYAGCRTDEFIASFKNFHPSIDLVVFREAEIQATFRQIPGLNFLNAKATFAKKLYNDYDLVVNIDADHLIFGELTEILAGDYDVAAPANYNVWNNVNIEVISNCRVDGHSRKLGQKMLVPFEAYIQGGLIASPSKQFWDAYEYASLNSAHIFPVAENDVLNILCHFLPYKVKILDGHLQYTHKDFKCYYGCASLGREKQIVVNNNRLELDGKHVKAYHFARGGPGKLHPAQLFSPSVCEFIYGTMMGPDAIVKYNNKKKREKYFVN